jgi:acyl transferase domain-containing protein/7-keto-8-aminopelargonate synthetase-like enzyme
MRNPIQTKSVFTPEASLGKTPNEPIAIIGMGCRFPGGAHTPNAYWRLLQDGIDAITEMPATRSHMAYANGGTAFPHRGGFLEQADQFDTAFFRIAPREVAFIDPQQRLLLEVSWEALEHAGINPETLAGTETGVFVGLFSNDYQRLQVRQNNDPTPYFGTGTSPATASGRLSYFFDFHGPAVSVDTASSASLVAFHLACQSLQYGECHLALAAGVNLILSPELSIAFAKAGMLSPDGRCKSFDSAANGYVRGEGCGVVVLKRLVDARRDNDPVLAVVRGTAINQDGASSGMTMPNGRAQEAVIRKALAAAGLEPYEISYVEAHGSGTVAGDPIEGRALQAIYEGGRTTPLVVGSAKTNIGHLEAAAGIAGVIKTVLALQHGYIPPHLHFNELNPQLAGWQAVIPSQGMAWAKNDMPRRAGVSSFGFSGTNAHVILEEAPAALHDPGATVNSTGLAQRPYHFLTLSAKNEAALRALAQRYAEYLDAKPDVALADVCFTANSGRAHFDQRLAVVAESVEEVRQELVAYAAGGPTLSLVGGQVEVRQRPKIAFLFTGQGSQYAGMGRQLYETQPIFRRAIDRCDEILRPCLEKSLIGILSLAPVDQSAIVNQTAYTQPALFALEYALFELWKSWGIEPDYVLGHSVGELVAAQVAGVFDLESGLKFAAERGRLMQSTQAGEMVAIMADPEQVMGAIRPHADWVSVAVINGPQNVVIAGESHGVNAVLAALPEVKTTKLNVSHAFHSPLMEPILSQLERTVANITLAQPQIPLVSNVTGQIESKLFRQPAYWRRHARETVRFADGMWTLHQQGVDIFIEIGPKPILLGMGRQCLNRVTGLPDEDVPRPVTAWLPSLRPERSDWQQMLETVAELYLRGMPIDWSGVAQDHAPGRQRLALPTYPFQRQRYWLVSTPTPASNGAAGEQIQRQSLAVTNDPSLRVAFDLDPTVIPYLRHHRIFGKAVLSAGAYWEAVLITGKDMFSVDQLRLENVKFQQALMLTDEPQVTQTMQIVLTPGEGETSAFQIHTITHHADSEPTWIHHASGQLALTNVSPPAAVDLATLRQHCTEPVVVTTFYAQTAARAIEYRVPTAGDGLTFQVLVELWRGPNAALGHLQIDSALAAKVAAYPLQAVLLEGGVQVAIATFPAAHDGETYIPAGLERLSLFRANATILWAYACLRPTKDVQDMLIVDVLLLDDQGVIAALSGLAFKRTTRESLFHPARQAQQGARKVRRADLLEQLAQEAPSQRKALLQAYVEKQVRQVMGLRTAQPLPPERPLKDLGLDSLMGTELTACLNRELKVSIPVERILQGASIQGISEIVLDKLALDMVLADQAALPTAPANAADNTSNKTIDKEPDEPADFSAAAKDVPQIYATVTEQHQRKLEIEGRWVYDFASCNYLGLDLHPKVMAAIPPAIAKWGIHPSWTRAVASPGIYDELEQELADLVGAPSVLVFSAITLLHAGVMPVLAGYDGIIFKDISAHRSIYEACLLARANGAEVIDFKHNDAVDLAEKLARYPVERTKIIAIDGVYSMSGAYPPLLEFARLAKQYNAWVYMDDAHGLGVIGENPTAEMPYGTKGNGVVRYYGLDYARDRLIYVAGLSKSYSSFGAFITCTDEAMKNKFRSASTFIFSGPSPTASLASALAGLRLNRTEGDQWRRQVYALTYKLVTKAKAIGFEVVNENFFPIVGVVIGKTKDVIAACKVLWDYGILITPALFPIVPHNRGLLRFSITAANTEEEIDRSLEALAAVRERLLYKKYYLDHI